MTLFNKSKYKRGYNLKDVYFNRINVIFFGLALILVTVFSVGYSILTQRLDINANIAVGGTSGVVITGMKDYVYNAEGYDVYNPTFNDSTLNFNIDLPQLESSVKYTVTILNNTDKVMELINVDENPYTNESIKYNFSKISVGDILQPGESKDFKILFTYDEYVTSVPTDTTIQASLNFIYREYVAPVYAYADEGILLDLRGYETPVNNIWEDHSGQHDMTLTNALIDTNNSLIILDTNAMGTANTPIIPETGDFTIEVMFREPPVFSTKDDQAMIAQVSNSSNDNGRFKIGHRYRNSKYGVTGFYNDTATNNNIFLDFITGQYPSQIIQISLSREGDYFYYYMNGGLVGKQSYSSSAKISQGPFKIGYWNASSEQRFTGGIYAIRIYNRSLTAEERSNNLKTDNYNYLKVIKSSDLLNYCIDNQTSSSGDGLHVYNGRFAYTGTYVNNYLKFFSSTDVYRIVSFEEDGTMKIINTSYKYNIPFDIENNRNITTSPYCVSAASGCNAWATSTSFLGKSDGSDVVADISTANKFLNEEYYPTLNADVKSMIVNHNFGFGLIGFGTSYNTAFNLSQQQKWKGNIGLLGVEDAMASCGMTSIKTNNSCVSYLNTLLNNNIAMWLINGNNANTYDQWVFMSPNTVSARRASRVEQSPIYFYVYPVMYVDSNVNFTGTGTEFDPFIIE